MPEYVARFASGVEGGVGEKTEIPSFATIKGTEASALKSLARLAM